MALYRFYKRGSNNQAVPVLEVTDFPFHWQGDPQTLTLVRNQMAANGLSLDNFQHCEKMPNIFLNTSLVCRRVK